MVPLLLPDKSLLIRDGVQQRRVRDRYLAVSVQPVEVGDVSP